MARQHFFSRVPSRMSLYNRTDGPDTFAVSEGVGADFVEKELFAISNLKPTEAEATMIRQDLLRPIYYQKCAADGQLVQGRMSFSSTDYTGERSSHIAHNLILSEEESQRILTGWNTLSLDKNHFENYEELFDFTDPASGYETTFPGQEITAAEFDEDETYQDKYLPESYKKLILAILLAVGGKYKSVILSVDEDMEHFSEEALNIINYILRVFPYSFRRRISFITYTGDVNRSNRFRLKFMPKEAMDKKLSGHVYINMSNSFSQGIVDADITAEAPVINFLYEILRNKEIRREFIVFINQVDLTIDKAEKPNLKRLHELIYVFRYCCGLPFEKQPVIDDEKLIELWNQYDRYRKYLPDEYRIAAVRALSFYQDTYMPIAKPIFTKISKVYPTEPYCVRSRIMGMVCDMFHTDLMRDKLFTFMKNNFSIEDQETKARIIENFSRVFYGGFLQKQILGFAGENFADMDEASVDILTEKFLLAIRTADIQQDILAFIEQHYEALSQKSRKLFYDTVTLMIPEGDALAQRLLIMADNGFEGLTPENKKAYIDQVCIVAEREAKHIDDKLLPMLCRRDYVFSAELMKKVVGEWKGKRIYQAYINRMSLLPVPERTSAAISLWQLRPDMSEKDGDALLRSMADAGAKNIQHCTVDGVLEGITALRKAAKKIGTPAAASFAEGWIEKVMTPAMAEMAEYLFRMEYKPEDPEKVYGYLKSTEEKDRAANVKNYIAAKRAVMKDDADKFFELYGAFTGDRRDMIAYMTKDLEQTPLNPDPMLYMFSMLSSYEAKGKFGPKTLWQEGYGKKEYKEFIESAGRLWEELKRVNGAETGPDNTGIADLIRDYTAAGGRKSLAETLEIVAALPEGQKGYAEYCKSTVEAIKKAQGGFFSNLFKKK